MIKVNQRILNFFNAATDGMLILSSYLLSTWLYLDVFQNSTNMAVVSSLRQGVGLVACCYAFLMVIVLAMFKMYNPSRIRRIRMSIIAIWGANALGLLLVATILYVFRLQEFSRGVLVTFYITGSSILSAKHIALRMLLHYIRKKGYNQKHVLVAGTSHLAIQYAADIKSNSNFGFLIDGFFGANPPEDESLRYLGNFENMDKKLQGTDIDEVVVALEPSDIPQINNIIKMCEHNGVKVSVVPFYNDLIPAQPTIDIIGKTKLINLRSNPLDNVGYAVIKRMFDAITSALLLIILSPLLLISMLGVRLSSPGPVIFKQQRMGRNKRLFTMYKLRSMQVNTEQDSAWTTDDDERKTRFGSFLRKFSIDELPQLYNVFRGDMSLVGPRPEIPVYVEQFKDSVPLYMVKHQVRPGMTGWAQIHGYRGDTSIPKRIEYDIWYIENWSIGLDLRILLQTALGGWRNKERLKSKDGDTDKNTTA